MATSPFGKAFQAARKSGLKEFSFGGKQYHTRTREEEDTRKKAASLKPAAVTAKRKSDLVPAATTAKRREPAKAAKPTTAALKAMGSPGERGAALARANALPGRKGYKAPEKPATATKKPSAQVAVATPAANSAGAKRVAMARSDASRRRDAAPAVRRPPRRGHGANPRK